MSFELDWRQYTHIQPDDRALVLVALFTFVIGGASLLYPWFTSLGVQSVASGHSTAEQAAGGIGWAVFEAAFAAMLLGLLVVWRRLPEWLRAELKKVFVIGGLMWIGAAALANGLLWSGVGLLIGARLVFRISKHYDVFWAVNDLLAIGLAIYIGASAGIVLGPVILGVGFVGLAIYDHIFADRQFWMFSIARWTVKIGLPLLIIIPEQWRLDWDQLADTMDGEGEAPMGFGIGMADLALPAAFAVALANSGATLPFAGAVAGVLIACARVSYKMEHGGGAGLPSLATGALAGWAIATVVVLV